MGRVPMESEAMGSERELLRQMAKAMYAVHRRLEFYTKREIESPSNHQEFAREAEEELDGYNLALNAYNEWAIKSALTRE